MVYDFFETEYIGPLFLASDEQGLRYVRFEKSRKPFQIESDWKQDSNYFKRVKAQLRAYFNSELKQFDLTLALEGTAFQKSVWKTLQDIPYGTVTTYQWVANQEKIPSLLSSRVIE